ncbi:MAG: hypothetical protein EA377_02960 [Phycisphaerales bacterium]|nr:MAG: hypothetical protein EA377_02960 [Phycisphaerales bacterium]
MSGAADFECASIHANSRQFGPAATSPNGLHFIDDGSVKDDRSRIISHRHRLDVNVFRLRGLGFRPIASCD